LDLISARDERLATAVDEIRAELGSRQTALGTPAAWFLGPKAENEALLRSLIEKAISSHCEHRRRFQPNDPVAITEQEKNSEAYLSATRALVSEATSLFDRLRRSVPFYSMRYQGHMLWDLALPAVVGYFGAMLYNQNNVAAEASPVTTAIEMEVGDQLCAMLGFSIKEDPRAWGHITAGGNIANIEAMWAARNAKLLALSLKLAAKSRKRLGPALKLPLVLANGRVSTLGKASHWELLNIPLDVALGLPDAAAQLTELTVDEVSTELKPFTVQTLGIAGLLSRVAGVREPVVIVPATAHYSLQKAMALLGLGEGNLLRVKVDLDGRMDMTELEVVLQRCTKKLHPVIAVVAVMGTTEQSAVDPLDDILVVRERWRAKGIAFFVHADAAWGGYFRTTMSRQEEAIPEWPMAMPTVRHYRALPRADSITVDPHKAGYVPYPAGALCYRNGATRWLVSFAAPVVWKGKADPTVGIFGIEGSKPGAAPAAVYLAHTVIPLDEGGYGQILKQCIWVSKRLYCRLITIDDPAFRMVFFQRLPAERTSPGNKRAKQNQLERIRAFDRMTDAELESHLIVDGQDRELFGKLGSEQVILAYSFNFVTKSGPNKDLERMNKLNAKVAELCMVTDTRERPDMRLILTDSTLTPDTYGEHLLTDYCSRVGVSYPKGKGLPVRFLISTTMDPWTTQQLARPNDSPGSFLDEIESALTDVVRAAIKELGFA